MSTDVRQILDRISQLPDDLRAELDAELMRREEHEWLTLQAEARRQAQKGRIDDSAINDAVESLRYGKKSTRR